MQTRLHDFTSFSTGLLADLERSEQCQNKVPISLCHWHRTEQRASCVLSLSRSAVNCLCSGAALLHIHSLWGPIVFYCFSIIADHVIWQFFFFFFFVSHLCFSGSGQNALQSAGQQNRAAAGSHSAGQRSDGVQVWTCVLFVFIRICSHSFSPGNTNQVTWKMFIFDFRSAPFHPCSWSNNNCL